MHVIWLALAWVALIGLARLHAHWMVGRAAVPARDSIDEAVGAGPVPAHIDPPRDRYGRFISPKSWRSPVPSRDREGLARASARPGETQWSPAELLGVSPKYEKKATPFVPPGDLTNTDALQLALRAWVLENLTTMVNNPRNSLWGVFNVLQRTWAVDQLALRAQAVSAGMVGRAAVPARDSARAVPVGAAHARPAPASKTKPPDKWCDEALEYYGFKNVLTLPKHLSDPDAWQPEPVAPPSVAAASSRAKAAEFNHRGTETQRTAVPEMVGRDSVPLGVVGRAAVPARDSAPAKRVAQPSPAVKDSQAATSSDRPFFGGHGGPPHHMSPPAATPAAVGHESIIPTERAGSPRSGTPSAFRLWPSALPNMPLDPRPETLDPVFQPP